MASRTEIRTRRTFIREVRSQIALARDLTVADARRIRELYEGFQMALAQIVASRDLRPEYLVGLKVAIREEVAILESQLLYELDRSTRRAAEVGSSIVTSPFSKLSGGLIIGASLMGTSPESLQIASLYSADLIRVSSGGIAASILRKINTELSLASIGGMTGAQAMRNISRALGSGGQLTYEAERIFRTEVLRIQSMVTQASLERAVTMVPGLQKAWIWSRISRMTHMEAEETYGPKGTPIPVDEPFTVDGEELMFPRDPAGSPHNTINCGCFHVPVVPDFGNLASAA